MKVRSFICAFAVFLTACLTLSCKSGTTGRNPKTASDGTAFIERSYWIDSMSTRVSLVFYYVDKPFAKTEDDIEKCTIGNGADIVYNCNVIEFVIDDDPIYTVDKIKYYRGRLTIEPIGINSSIGDTQITIKTKKSEAKSYPIGNFAYTKIDHAANQNAADFIEYALLNPALYSENDRPKTAAFAIEMNVLKDITVNRFDSASNMFGFDIRSSRVYSYDEYMSTLSDALENMELDQLIPGIYERKIVDRKATADEIELKAGRYVLIVPVVQYESEIPEPAFSGIDIGFSAETGNYILHVNCNPTVIENFHVQDEVEALFGE